MCMQTVVVIDFVMLLPSPWAVVLFSLPAAAREQTPLLLLAWPRLECKVLPDFSSSDGRDHREVKASQWSCAYSEGRRGRRSSRGAWPLGRQASKQAPAHSDVQTSLLHFLILPLDKKKRSPRLVETMLMAACLVPLRVAEFERPSPPSSRYHRNSAYPPRFCL